MVSDMDKVIERIKEVCNEEAREFIENKAVYDASIDIVLDDDTYIMIFTVDGTSGTVIYRTPILKVGDDIYFKGREDEVIEDHRDYCSKILNDMSRLASEEY